MTSGVESYLSWPCSFADGIAALGCRNWPQSPRGTTAKTLRLNQGLGFNRRLRALYSYRDLGRGYGSLPGPIGTLRGHYGLAGAW